MWQHPEAGMANLSTGCQNPTSIPMFLPLQGPHSSDYSNSFLDCFLFTSSAICGEKLSYTLLLLVPALSSFFVVNLLERVTCIYFSPYPAIWLLLPLTKSELHSFSFLNWFLVVFSMSVNSHHSIHSLDPVRKQHYLISPSLPLYSHSYHLSWITTTSSLSAGQLLTDLRAFPSIFSAICLWYHLSFV